MREKVSGAIAIPKASWECAPALPNRIGEVFLRELFSVTSRRQIKVFRCSSFSKMLPRCGRAAHICGANETVQESVSKLKESQLPLKSEGCNDGTRFQGQLRFPRQAGDVLQPCQTEFGWYSQKNFSQGKRSSASGKRGFHPCFCLRLIIGNQIEKFICLWLVLFQPTSKRFPFLQPL